MLVLRQPRLVFTRLVAPPVSQRGRKELGEDGGGGYAQSITVVLSSQSYESDRTEYRCNRCSACSYMSYTDVDYRISDVRIMVSSCKPVLTGDLGL